MDLALLVFEVSLRALLLAGGVGVVLAVLRVRSSSVRYAAWAGVLVGMLTLPLWATRGPKLSLHLLPTGVRFAIEAAQAQADADAGETGLVAPVPISAGGAEIVPDSLQRVTPTPDLSSDTTNDPAWHSVGLQRAAAYSQPWFWWTLLGIYLAGALALLGRLLARTIREQAVVGRASACDDFLSSDECAAPVTVGWLHPVVVLPADWGQWSEERLAAAREREEGRVRRRDPLVRGLARLNRALFWFHPLAWWLPPRLARLANASAAHGLTKG